MGVNSLAASGQAIKAKVWGAKLSEATDSSLWSKALYLCGAHYLSGVPGRNGRFAPGLLAFGDACCQWGACFFGFLYFSATTLAPCAVGCQYLPVD